MFREIVFSVICAFVIPPILMPGDRAVMVESGALVCPKESKKDGGLSTVRRLKRRLFSQLGSSRAVESHAETADIYIRMDAESLYCYERNEEVVLEAYMTLSWPNKFVCWNPADFDNVENVTFRYGWSWMPKLISYSKSIETYHIKYGSSSCKAFSNGTISCRMIVYVNGPCEMSLRGWPEASHATCWISLDIFNPTGRQKLLHRDDRSEYEWLRWANKGNPGQFIVTGVERDTNRNGVVYRFRFRSTTSAFGRAVISVAAVLSVVLLASFALPAGSSARMSLMGCATIGLLLSIGFLANQLSSVTPYTPVIVRLHSDLLIIAGVALLPATLLAPRLVPTKPYAWQLRCRSWLLGSSVGRFVLRIFRVPNPSEGVTPLGEEGEQSTGTSFQKDDSAAACQRKDEPTRTLLFTLTDRVLALVCCISLFAVWLAMLYGQSESVEDMYYMILGTLIWRRRGLSQGDPE